MIDKLIEYSISHKLTIGILTLILVIFGTYSISKLPIDAVPDVTNNQVQIITQNPNLAPYEMEKFITSPIELAMANTPGLLEIRSISKFGLSSVILVFDDETEVYRARQLVMERLKDLEQDIPKSMGVPTLAPVATGLSEVYQYVLVPKQDGDTTYSLMDLRTIQDWIVRKKLLGTEGVADVSSFGGKVKEYQAKVKPELLRSTGVTMQELFAALENGNSNTGGAYIEKEGIAYLIRGIGLAQNIEDINNILIKSNGTVPVYVKDVANVEFGYSVRYGGMTKNGKGEVVGAVVLMRKGENASKVVANIKKRISEIEEFLPDDLKIEVFIDRESLVNRAIKTVVKNLFEAFLIVVFVVLIFLGDFRASLLVASVIPLSLFTMIILMNYFHVGGNLMSLGAIDFGLTVDPAIIVVESVVVSLAMGLKNVKPHLMQDAKDLIVRNATFEIKRSVVYGGLIILIVYFPIMTLSGIEGKMFTPMALAVSFAIIGAIILALTYVPMMSALVLKPHDPEHKNFADKMVDAMHRAYEPILHFSFRFKYTIISFSFAMLYVAYLVFSNMGGEFIPKLDEGDYNIEVRNPVGVSLTETIELSNTISKIFCEKYPDEIETIVAKIGTSEIPTDPVPFESMDLMVTMKDKSLWKVAKTKEEFTELLSKDLAKFSGLTISFSQPIESRFNDMLSGAKTDVVIKVFGDDLDKLTKIGNQISGILRKLNGSADVQVQKLGGLPQIMVKYDRRLIAYYGIQISEINNLIQVGFAGSKTGKIYEGENRFDLSVRLDNENRNGIEDLMNLQINTNKGITIPLREVAEIKIEKGASEISRENGQRKLNVGFNVRGRDIESIVSEAQLAIDKQITLPNGYRLDYGGAFENLLRAKSRLSVVLPLSLIIIFFLLYATFGTFGDSLLVFSGIPLSAVGGIIALSMSGMAFSISAGIGFISLFGIAVLNGILLIGHFKTLAGRRGIDDIYERVEIGIKERFRQVLMTSATAALGFLPMALSHGAGAEIQKPLATVVIGGLITSTILTLVVLPILYIVFNDRKINLKF